MRDSIPVTAPARARSQFNGGFQPHYDAAALLRHEETLLRETHHRICNSLQIIASLLALDARRTSSGEARQHLRKAQQRIIAVATVQRQLQGACGSDEIQLAPYLSELGASLSASVIGDAARIAIDIHADACAVPSDAAARMGLIVAELVINAVKHAFRSETTNGVIVVTYRIEEQGWRLTVSDNGVAAPDGLRPNHGDGSGTDIVASLVESLGARIETSRRLDPAGTAVSIYGPLTEAQAVSPDAPAAASSARRSDEAPEIAIPNGP